MRWFKNLIIYQINKDMSLSREQLESALSPMRFSPCGHLDRSKISWLPIVDADSKGALVYENRNQLLLCAVKEEKILPASVVEQLLTKKIIKLEQTKNNRLTKKEKLSLKEEAINELLPRAFSRFKKTELWIHPEENLLIANSRSATQTEEILSMLRKGLGSLPVKPLQVSAVEAIYNDWVIKNNPPTNIMLLNELELKSNDGAIIQFKNEDIINNDEIIAYIKAEKHVTKLKLNWSEQVEFILTNEIRFNRLHYSQLLKNQNEDIDKQDESGRLAADFILMTSVLSPLIKQIIAELNNSQ